MANSDKMLDDLLKKEDNYISEYDKENYILGPLVDEINLIENEGVKSFTRAILLKSDSFWQAPASVSEDLNPFDEHEVGGAVLHTKRVFRIVRLLTECYMLSQAEKDLLFSATLLHDITKHVDVDGILMLDPFYPYTLEQFIRTIRNSDQAYASENQSSTLFVQDEIVARILRIVRCQRGPWSPVPETIPIEESEMIMHMADHLAERLDYIIDGEDLVEARWRV